MIYILLFKDFHCLSKEKENDITNLIFETILNIDHHFALGLATTGALGLVSALVATTLAAFGSTFLISSFLEGLSVFAATTVLAFDSTGASFEAFL